MNALVLQDHERTPCEVWTRVMGYHRPLAFFNRGKRAEHEERLLFREQCVASKIGHASPVERARS